jgi:hypothetical protein
MYSVIHDSYTNVDEQRRKQQPLPLVTAIGEVVAERLLVTTMSVG